MNDSMIKFFTYSTQRDCAECMSNVITFKILLLNYREFWGSLFSSITITCNYSLAFLSNGLQFQSTSAESLPPSNLFMVTLYLCQILEDEMIVVYDVCTYYDVCIYFAPCTTHRYAQLHTAIIWASHSSGLFAKSPNHTLCQHPWIWLRLSFWTWAAHTDILICCVGPSWCWCEYYWGFLPTNPSLGF